jgi:hypothetical protein
MGMNAATGGATAAAPGTTLSVSEPAPHLDETGFAGVFDLVDLMLRSSKGAPDLGPKEMLDGLVASAPEVVSGVEWSSLTLVRSGVLKTLSASADEAVRLDEMQYAIGSGPCIEAILDDNVFVTGDLASDGRWPEFGRRAAEEHDVQSALAMRLVLLDESKVLAGVNLFSRTGDAFDDVAVRQATMLATQCSLLVTAYLASDEAENLARALETNREIGVAMGVLMAKHNLTREQAFGLLRMASQDSNRKLADLAVEVADTGQVPLRRLHRSR